MSKNDQTLPRDPDTLVALLESLAATRPDDTAYVFLQDGDEGESRMTYAELRDAARRVASICWETGAARMIRCC